MLYSIIYTEDSPAFPFGATFEAANDLEAVKTVNAQIGSGQNYDYLADLYKGKQLVKQMLLSVMTDNGRKFTDILLFRNKTKNENLISLVPPCNVSHWTATTAC